VLLARLRRLGREPESGFAYVEAAPESGSLRMDDPGLSEADAHVIEDDSLRAHNVGTARESAFTSFLDGMQRADVRLYHGPVPIVYAYGAAVVRSRADRVLHTHSGATAGPLAARMHEEREALFFPYRYVAPDALHAAGVMQSQTIDTGPPDTEPLPLFPPHLLQRAARRINAWREDLEAQLGSRWCRESDSGWLLVDGTLTLTPEISRCARAVGAIRSHNTRFFDGDDARTILGLQAGHRTSVFQPGTRQYTPVYSWYLRLREPARHGVFWGLIRVEAAANADTVARADEISRWLLAETTPLSLPDARWDRLLYPIHDCETYLRSRAPNI
jgi:hypothetical protein